MSTTAPTRAMIGICTCGVPGCGSLWMQVRREHNTVVWEPTDTYRDSIHHEYRFALMHYLDALDSITHRAGETRATTLARELRGQREDIDGLRVYGERVLDIWQTPDTVTISTAPDSAVNYHRFTVSDEDTASSVLLQVHQRILEGHNE